MTILVLRMRNGNCVVAAAESEAAARERVKDIGRNVEIASVRELSSFVAQFTLTDEGEIVSTLLDQQTLFDLHSHEYPMLYAARYLEDKRPDFLQGSAVWATDRE